MDVTKVTIFEISTLKNKNLQKHVSGIKKAIDANVKTSWEIAAHIKDIVVGELYKEDFETEENLAKAFGMSRPNLNKMKNAVLYRDEAGLSDYTVTKVMELLAIPLERLNEFIKLNNITPDMTQKAIREIVKEWRIANGLLKLEDKGESDRNLEDEDFEVQEDKIPADVTVEGEAGDEKISDTFTFPSLNADGTFTTTTVKLSAKAFREIANMLDNYLYK